MTRFHDLTPAQLRDLEAELRYDLARLERSSVLEHAPASDPYSIDTMMSSSAHGGLAVALEERARTRHAQVKDALDRLASGDYGICESCQRAIPYGRLMIMPETSYCKSCGGAS
jgi:RNA polymerase-binding transcription factor DksA